MHLGTNQASRRCCGDLAERTARPGEDADPPERDGDPERLVVRSMGLDVLVVPVAVPTPAAAAAAAGVPGVAADCC
jgi:hypothetical protein